MDFNALIEAAFRAREFSYAPYSGFQVGAALMSADGQIFTGCNIESASYSPTNCAERTAVFKAVSEGVRDFSAIAIVGGPSGSTGSPQNNTLWGEDPKDLDFCFPCGVCRQVLVEFADDDFKVIVAKGADDYQVFTLGELVPHAFRLES